MSIQWRNDPEGNPVLALSETFNFSCRQEFMTAIHRFGNDVPALAALKVDLSRLEHIDSTGLGLLLMLKERSEEFGQPVILSQCSQAAREAFSIARFDKIFTIT